MPASRSLGTKQMENKEKKITSSKPIPHIPLPFKEVMSAVLQVKPLEKAAQKSASLKKPKK